MLPAESFIQSILPLSLNEYAIYFDYKHNDLHKSYQDTTAFPKMRRPELSWTDVHWTTWWYGGKRKKGEECEIRNWEGKEER